MNSYLRTPTFAEVIYANRATFYSGDLAYEFLEELSQDQSILEVMKREFILPEEVVQIQEEGLLGVIRNFQIQADPNTNKHLGNQIEYEDSIYLNNYFQAISPQITMQNKINDCVGLAVLAVALSRESGYLARLISSTEIHMVYEKFFGGRWVTLDTQKGQIDNVKRTPDFGKYYQKTIETFSN